MFINQMFMLTALAIGSVAGNYLWAQSPDNTDLYAQTSEMNNTMINYDADLGSINRFYSTNGAGGWGRERQVSNYNSPERRARLLQLNHDYLKQLEKLGFDNMSINGKVDFILFKRNLEDAKYQWQEEQKNYGQV